MSNKKPTIRRPETMAVLVISDLPSAPDAITARLGVLPSHVVEQGKRTSMGYIGKTNSWSVKTKKSNEQPLNTHVTSLLSKFDGRWNELVGVCLTAQVELLCELWIEGDSAQLTFDIGFSSTNVRKLAELSATIGFDVYTGDGS